MMTHCQNCGAPVNPHAEKCEYCDTYYPHPQGSRITQTANCITIDLNPVQLAGAAVEALERGLLTPNEARRRLGIEGVMP